MSATAETSLTNAPPIQDLPLETEAKLRSDTRAFEQFQSLPAAIQDRLGKLCTDLKAEREERKRDPVIGAIRDVIAEYFDGVGTIFLLLTDKADADFRRTVDQNVPIGRLTPEEDGAFSRLLALIETTNGEQRERAIVAWMRLAQKADQNVFAQKQHWGLSEEWPALRKKWIGTTTKELILELLNTGEDGSETSDDIPANILAVAYDIAESAATVVRDDMEPSSDASEEKADKERKAEVLPETVQEKLTELLKQYTDAGGKPEKWIPKKAQRIVVEIYRLIREYCVNTTRLEPTGRSGSQSIKYARNLGIPLLDATERKVLEKLNAAIGKFVDPDTTRKDFTDGQKRLLFAATRLQRKLGTNDELEAWWSALKIPRGQRYKMTDKFAALTTRELISDIYEAAEQELDLRPKKKEIKDKSPPPSTEADDDQPQVPAPDTSAETADPQTVTEQPLPADRHIEEIATATHDVLTEQRLLLATTLLQSLNELLRQHGALPTHEQSGMVLKNVADSQRQVAELLNSKPAIDHAGASTNGAINRNDSPHVSGDIMEPALTFQDDSGNITRVSKGTRGTVILLDGGTEGR